MIASCAADFKNALDVGCGEGRFCRRLKAFGVAVEEACECVMLAARCIHLARRQQV